MLDKIIQSQSFSESEASRHLGSLLDAISYMHSLDIVHLDLKCQNVMFDVKGPDGVLKIIDFGGSMIVDDDGHYNSESGTIHYIPPEFAMRLRSGKDLKKGDLWSMGVIAYVWICGRPPFNGKDQRAIYKAITAKNKIIQYPKHCANISNSCKNFL